MNDVFFDGLLLSTMTHIGVGYLMCAAVMGYIVFLSTIKAKVKEKSLSGLLSRLLIIIQLIMAFFGILIVPSIFLSEYRGSERVSDGFILFVTVIGMLACIVYVINYWKNKVE